ncbi:MAG TPA: ZIP family metal transporter [Phycisphaerae bacterium]|nr:ZIP family metal transporter [Phycisphaerae bacterium]
MNASGWIAVYSLGVLAVSLGGGLLPLTRKITHSRLQLYLSASAGVMLGAAFFHIIPDAVEFSGGNFGWWMSLGVVGLFCIERFIAPHTHEGEGHLAEHQHAEGEFVPVNPQGLDHGHIHVHGPECGHHQSPLAPLAPAAMAGEDACTEPDHYTAAPAFSGWMAVLGLTLHTFMNGVGLGGAVIAGLDGSSKNAGWLAQFSLPGVALFLAIALHKPADALAVTMMLSRRGVSRGRMFLVQLGFALMVPVGAFLFVFLGHSFEAKLQTQFVGAALAFSAGTFLFIALSDLLPEVQFHRHDRGKLFAALLAGVALMGLIAVLEGHVEGGG